MATTTATITLASTDLTDNALSISKPPLTRIKYANLLQHNAKKMSF